MQKITLKPPKKPSNNKDVLAYEFEKMATFPGKILYGLTLALAVDASSHAYTGDQDFIDSLWEELLHLPSSAAIQGIGVKEITQWPPEDPDVINEIPPKHRTIFEKIAPQIPNANQKYYNVFIGILTHDPNMVAATLGLEPAKHSN